MIKIYENSASGKFLIWGGLWETEYKMLKQPFNSLTFTVLIQLDESIYHFRGVISVLEIAVNFMQMV